MKSLLVLASVLVAVVAHCPGGCNKNGSCGRNGESEIFLRFESTHGNEISYSLSS